MCYDVIFLVVYGLKRFDFSNAFSSRTFQTPNNGDRWINGIYYFVLGESKTGAQSDLVLNR